MFGLFPARFYDFFLLLVSYDHEPDHLWSEEKELHARQFAAKLLKESCEMRLECNYEMDDRIGSAWICILL